uniref:Uncharacterized protein n=1 Tax=viral metagenome TaxID=1070528 RepID=A0A6C0KPZ4_9ZZZZ
MYWTKELQIDIASCLILGVIFFIVDISSFNYKNKSVYPILLLHHILNIFAQFGFLARDKNVLIIYIFTPLLVILHWATNGNKCFLTEMVNKACGTHERFRDIWYLLGFKNLKHYTELHYGYLFVAWIIAVIRYIKLS